jgi:hypothetical protein
MRISRLWLAAAFLLACVPAHAQTQPKEFQSKEGGFAVRAPGQPQRTKRAVTTNAGPIDTFFFIFETADGALMVAYNDYPAAFVASAGADKIVQDARDAAAKNGKLASERKVTLAGYPGRELRLDGGPMNLSMRTRIFLVKERLYQVTAVLPPSQIDGARANSYLDSFRLLQAEPARSGFESREGGFAVAFPGEPKYQKQSLNTAAGQVELHTFTSEAGDLVYMVAYLGYPKDFILKADPEKMLDGGRDGAVRNVKGTLASEQRITLAGHPGREILVDAPMDISMVARFFLVENRLYQALAVGPRARVTGAAVKSFLNSFKLIQAAK